jgi:hypothetical protein
MDFTLYRAVGTLKRVALGDLATAEYYAAEKDDKDGRITLIPVNIVAGGKRTGSAADDDEDENEPAF